MAKKIGFTAKPKKTKQATFNFGANAKPARSGKKKTYADRGS